MKQWISINDKLPETTGDYLVTDGDVCMVSAFKLPEKKFHFWDINWWEHSDVTHWMKLPKLPKLPTISNL